MEERFFLLLRDVACSLSPLIYNACVVCASANERVGEGGGGGTECEKTDLPGNLATLVTFYLVTGVDGSVLLLDEECHF